jgi:hypothetical protein
VSLGGRCKTFWTFSITRATAEEGGPVRSQLVYLTTTRKERA